MIQRRWGADRAVWGTQPYFFAGLLGFIPILAGWALLPAHRRDSCLAGLFWLPMAPAAALHTPYWWPNRLGGFAWGIEDLCYLFQVSVLAWLLTSAGVSRRYRLILPRRLNWRRYVGFSACGVALNLVLTGLGMYVFTALVLVNGLLVAWHLWRRPGYLPLALAGVLLFTPAMFLEQQIWLMLWPDFVEVWHKTTVWGQRCWGIPLGEIAFHASFVAATPLGVAYCREGRLEKINAQG